MGSIQLVAELKKFEPRLFTHPYACDLNVMLKQKFSIDDLTVK